MSAPNWRRPESDAALPQLQRLDDFYEGTDAVRKAGVRYIPRLSKESDDNWKMRSTGVAAPGHLTRTVEGSVGRIFAVAPTLTPNGYARITDEWQDIDGQGTHGDVWLARSSIYAILDGFSVTLVDAPTAPAPLVPLPEAARYRPRWIRYRRRQVLNWRTAVIDGRVVITMLALAESAEVEDGPWAVKSEERVRVLRQTGNVVTAEVWAEREVEGQGKAWVMLGEPVTYDGPTGIPMAIKAGGKLTAPFVARPPLLALCDKLIEFYQVANDIRHYERLGCFPQPVVVGQLTSMSGDGKLVLGPSSAVTVEMNGDFKWAELSGSSMEQLRKNQQERRQELGMLGLSFLVGETRQAETAQAKRLDSAAENATLADAARGIEDGCNVALAWHASYANVPTDQAPTISLNKNLSGDVLDAAMLRVLLDMRKSRELTFEEFRTVLARGRVIPSEMAEEDAVLAAELELALSEPPQTPDQPAPDATVPAQGAPA